MTPANLQTLSEEQHHLLTVVDHEFKMGLTALNSVNPYSVTFFGGVKIKETDTSYQEVVKLAQLLAKENWTIISGGGPGIMSAAMRGAASVNGDTLAFEIDINEEKPDYPAKKRVRFSQFIIRKYLLRQSDILIFAPGGYGTLDELMEILNLIKTDKFPKKPVYLLGKEFWKGIFDWINVTLVEDKKTIPVQYLEIFKIYDTAAEIFEDIIQQ